MESSDDEPLLAPTLPPTQPVSGTLPTWVDSGRSHVVPGRNVRPRLRVRSVPPTVDDVEVDREASAVSTVPASSRARLHSMSPTILDALEEDLEASAVSTVPASSRALRRLRLVSGRADDEPTESMGPDAVVHVMNIADPDSKVLSDTATDPDLGARVDNVDQGDEESEASSSGDDSIVDDREAHDVVEDVPVPDTAWDELIGDRATRAGFASLDRGSSCVVLTVRQSGSP